VAADADELLPVVMATATAVRRMGYGAEYALRPQQLGKQLKAADAAGARRAVILRREAVAAEGVGPSVTIKTLSDGGEEQVPLARWLDDLNQRRLARLTTSADL